MESISIVSDGDSDSDCCIIEEKCVNDFKTKSKDEWDSASGSKRVKQEKLDFPLPAFYVNKELGDGHCILHCFSEYFQ